MRLSLVLNEGIYTHTHTRTHTCLSHLQVDLTFPQTPHFAPCSYQVPLPRCFLPIRAAALQERAPVRPFYICLSDLLSLNLVCRSRAAAAAAIWMLPPPPPRGPDANSALGRKHDFPHSCWLPGGIGLHIPDAAPGSLLVLPVVTRARSSRNNPL